ncbi:protein-tyrosine-phosphatase [Agaribacter marinus]|uniref:protein-tyrosine-phosphatase n=1 Tax=Agaribacter marinus TaxID=1431249 RepID=A0AA37T699_9ALTE|nr:protein-tyrosine-phosphatase [Agaribacter marinus]
MLNSNETLGRIVAANSSPSLLFVCLGNICRSPTAEGVFRDKASNSGIEVTIDSAGTGGYHIGSPPDKRSQEVALSRGYDLSNLQCRRVHESDFDKFDIIIAMDKANERDLLRKCPDEHKHKVKLFMSYCDSEFDEVPDPYYTGKKGFELVLDLIEQASDGLLLKVAG